MKPLTEKQLWTIGSLAVLSPLLILLGALATAAGALNIAMLPFTAISCTARPLMLAPFFSPPEPMVIFPCLFSILTSPAWLVMLPSTATSGMAVYVVSFPFPSFTGIEVPTRLSFRTLTALALPDAVSFCRLANSAFFLSLFRFVISLLAATLVLLKRISPPSSPIRILFSFRYALERLLISTCGFPLASSLPLPYRVSDRTLMLPPLTVISESTLVSPNRGFTSLALFVFSPAFLITFSTSSLLISCGFPPIFTMPSI